MKIQAGLLLVLLASTPVLAQDTSELIWDDGETGELLRWRVLEDNIEGPAVQSTGTLAWLKFHPYENAVPQGILFIDISVTYTFLEDSDGTWQYVFETDQGMTWDDCSWNVSTTDPGGFLAGDLVAYSTYTVHCASVGLIEEDATITYWINRTVISGAPGDIVDRHLSIVGDRGDFVIMSQQTIFELLTGYTAAEFLIMPALLLVALYLWTRNDLGVRLTSLLFVGMDIVLALGHYVRAPHWRMDLGIAVLLTILWAYMVAMIIRDFIKEKRATKGVL